MAGKMTRKTEPRATWELGEIRELIDLLIDRGIHEFEMEKDGLRVRIKRGNAADVILGQPAGPVAIPSSYLPPATPALPEPGSIPPAAEHAPDASEGLYIIKSPIVGTFYASPTPNAPPFAKVGDEVKAGQVLCIIEAMKLMNEIESEVAGEVERVYIESGQPVEYGQSLFAIQPSLRK